MFFIGTKCWLYFFGGNMRYKQVFDGEWIQPRRKNYYAKCCDCGLVHKIEFRLVGTKKRRIIQLRAKRIDSQKQL